jgi:sortase A
VFSTLETSTAEGQGQPRGAVVGGRAGLRRTLRWLGAVLIASGAALVIWTATVMLWEDPVTNLYTSYRQHSLADAFEERVDSWRLRPSVTGTAADTESPRPGAVRTTPTEPGPPPRPLKPGELRLAAAAYHREAAEGSAIARVTIPRLGLRVIVVNGTSSDDLRAGPGRHLQTAMPGEGRLVYIAGHRTTFGAPFARIDRMQPGDEVRVEVPYATLTYRVTGHTIVDDNDLSVLAPGSSERLALQACHPRFFASQRYIVWARLDGAFAPRKG